LFATARDKYKEEYSELQQEVHKTAFNGILTVFWRYFTPGCTLIPEKGINTPGFKTASTTSTASYEI
jgi:hypothetical protein